MIDASSPSSSSAIDFLSSLTPPLASFRTFTHAHVPASFAEAALERGQTAGQIIRSILFRISKRRGSASPFGAFVLVLTPATAVVCWPTLRKHLAASSVTMAREQEVQEVTGHRVGCVSPFGLLQPLRVLIDDSCFAPHEISIGSGILGTTVILSQADFQTALHVAEHVQQTILVSESGHWIT